MFPPKYEAVYKMKFTTATYWLFLMVSIAVCRNRGCWGYSCSDKCICSYQTNKITVLQRQFDVAQDMLICGFAKTGFSTLLTGNSTAPMKSHTTFCSSLPELLHHFQIAWILLLFLFRNNEGILEESYEFQVAAKNHTSLLCS